MLSIKRLMYKTRSLSIARCLTHSKTTEHGSNHNHHHQEPKLDGASLLAKSLKEQGVEYVFGVPGIPVISVAFKAQEYGLKYIAMRNEQPAVCLVVSGPGFINALSGMENANQNGWPLLVVGGSSETSQEGAGSFQEFRQVEAAKHFSKYAARPSSLSQLPSFLEKAIRFSTYGRPGASYIDMPADMINGHISSAFVHSTKQCLEPPRPYTSEENIANVFEAIRASTNPLLIVGKEAAYAQAEEELGKLAERLKLPFLPTPMGKGVIDDDSEYCVSSARSTALKQADLVILFGAKLDWMLHFGKPPRFHESVKIIHVDNYAEELGNNTNNCILIQADIRSFCEQMNEYMDANPKLDINSQAKKTWWDILKEKSEKNRKTIEVD